MRRALCAALLATTALAALAQASDYPSKPIRLITPFAAGASTDKLARLVADGMGKSLGQQVIVENRAGAGGNLAAEATATAAPDGYTFMLVSAGIVTMNQHIYKKLKFDAQKDLAPLTIAVRMPLVLVTTPQQPFKTAQQLIAHAKANPGKLTYGSAGIGTSQHLAGELFKSLSGTHIVHIPYRGGAPAMTDLLGGQIHLMFVQGPSALPQVKAGKLRALAVGSPQRSPLLPDVPTLAEVGLSGHDSDTWYGFVAPAGVPTPVLAKLQSAIVAALKDNAVRLEEDGFTLEASSAATMAQAVRSESVKWGEVIRRAKIEAE
jgi:tripartite-type tricarboxylate transporter receptor subunit TctC